jgi:hypothetical protein
VFTEDSVFSKHHILPRDWTTIDAEEILLRIKMDKHENCKDLNLNLHLRYSNTLFPSVCLRRLRKCRAAATLANEREINGEKKKHTNKQLRKEIVQLNTGRKRERLKSVYRRKESDI